MVPAAALLVLLLVLAAGGCSSSSGDGEAGPPAGASTTTTDDGRRCPAAVEAGRFAPAPELRRLLGAFNRFGLRSPGSVEHERSLDWLARELRAVPGMRISWERFTIDRWQPTPPARGATPGRDLAAAGALALEQDGRTTEVPVAGAVPFTLPTPAGGAEGPLVYLPAGRPVTAANAAGRVVVREIPHTSLPYAAFDAIGHHVTADLPRQGDYDRPYLRDLDGMLAEAGAAGAAGIVMVWDAPTDQMEGYWDPHTGTRFALPGVYVGADRLPALRAAARAGATARIRVRAEWDRAPTRNLIATLPGRTAERIVVNTNTDSVTWVQENGTVASIALARYLAGLPRRCRARTVQFALTSNHLGLNQDGVIRYADRLDRDYDDGTVAFVMVPEHLGTRELLPTGPGGRVEPTGEGETFAWSAPAESPVLVKASIDAVERRGLTRTAVLQGVGAPVEDQVPQICSQGGLGTVFHGRLIPTIAGISGPWSLWAPSFGEAAIDFDRMRAQTMAFGDVALALDDVPRSRIAGEYPAARRRRAQGAPTCPGR